MFRWMPGWAVEFRTLHHKCSMSADYVTQRWITWIPFNTQVSHQCMLNISIYYNPLWVSERSACTNYMLDLDSFFGDRLIYFIVMKYHDCSQCLPVNEMSPDFMIYSLCSMIWHERNLVMQMRIPRQLKDLFLEQSTIVKINKLHLINWHFNEYSFFVALLCGISGYTAFIDESIATKIVQWQLDNGCFEYFDGVLQDADFEGRKSKRRVDETCSDHMTGLAAAAFGLFAKITLQLHNQMLWMWFIVYKSTILCAGRIIQYDVWLNCR